jgi:hypothetical protein
MFEKEFSLFCKEFDIWIIVKTNNLRDIKRNKELLLKLFRNSSHILNKASYINYEVFKKLITDLSSLIYKHSKHPVIEFYKQLGIFDNS